MDDARVWAYWNHSFDMYLTYLWPASCGFSSWISLGYITDWRLDDGHPVSILRLLRAHHRAAIMWWLDGCNTLCLLIWQAVFFRWLMLLQGYPVWAHWASLKPKVRPAVYNTCFLENESVVEMQAGTLRSGLLVWWWSSASLSFRLS